MIRKAGTCPFCGGKTEAEYVDIGIGVQQVTAAECIKCGATQMNPYHQYDGVSEEEARHGWLKPPPGSGLTKMANFDEVFDDLSDAVAEIRTIGIDEFVDFAVCFLRRLSPEERSKRIESSLTALGMTVGIPLCQENPELFYDVLRSLPQRPICSYCITQSDTALLGECPSCNWYHIVCPTCEEGYSLPGKSFARMLLKLHRITCESRN